MVDIFEAEQKFDKGEFLNVCLENGFNFPPEYLAFLEKHNDGELDSNIISDFDECAVRYFYGTSDDDCSNFKDVLDAYKGRMPMLCVPIAEAEGGNLLCMSLDSNSYGRVVWWDHETMDVEEDEECSYSIGDMYVIAKDFNELLRKIVSDE